MGKSMVYDCLWLITIWTIAKGGDFYQHSHQGDDFIAKVNPEIIEVYETGLFSPARNHSKGRIYTGNTIYYSHGFSSGT